MIKKATFIVLVILLFCLACRKKKNTDNETGDFATLPITQLKAPEFYDNNSISCNLVMEKEYLLNKKILLKVHFRNTKDAPIPIEKRHLFISLDDKPNIMEHCMFDVYYGEEEVDYLGTSISRRSPEYPQDYYVMQPGEEYVAEINLTRQYDISRKGNYSIQYDVINALSDSHRKSLFWFDIESKVINFKIK